MELIYSLDDIETAAKELIKFTNGYSVVAFHGNLGAGKTTFIKAVCNQLGVEEKVSSPTFSIINQYTTGKGSVFHIDLYRIKNIEEAIDAGVEECIYSGEMCFIEWPEKVFSILPDDTVNVFIEPIDNSKRKLLYKLPP